MRWSKVTKNQTQPQTPTEYPAGTFVKSERGHFYIVSPTKRYRIVTLRCLDSWSPQRVVQTSENALRNYRIVAKMKFRNGSLIHNFADGKIYLISEGKRRHVQSPEALERIGAVLNDAISANPDEINLHDEGEPLV